MKTRFLLIGIVMLILIMPWSIGMAQDSEENEYSIWSLDINDFWRHNLTFNDFLPWLRLDHFMYYLPTASQVRKATECLDGIGKPLPVEMKYGITANPPSVYSQKDVEHPIVLIPAYTTNMDIRTFLPEEEIVDLISLTVPDGEGGWKDASEADREFYSYRMEGEWFKLRFPENKTKDFRCLAMTIGVMDRMGDSNGKSVMVPTDTTRTWIFIQLPWTNDFAILNQIPYTDFTPYKYEKRRAPADCEKPTGDKTTIGQKTLLRDNYIKYGRSFMLLPDFDEENPDPEKLFVGLLPMAQGGGSDLVTQMRIEDGNDNFCLYSSHDATHPIILLSAKETRIEVRVPPAYHIETDLAALLVPGKKDGWRDATKKERMFYSYSREGDWFKLIFPENRTGKFRCVVLEIEDVKRYKNIFGHSSIDLRTWLFIQLPWTEDPDILNHIPHKYFSTHFSGSDPTVVPYKRSDGKPSRWERVNREASNRETFKYLHPIDLTLRPMK